MKRAACPRWWTKALSTPGATSGCPLSAVRLSGLDRIRCPGSSETRVRFRPFYTRLVRQRRPYSGVGSPASGTWLFPGLRPGTSLSAPQLGLRLRRLGIEPASARRSALGHLAARLPAAMLAQVLGLSPLTAVRWAGSVGANWATYAAQFTRAQAATAD